MKHLLTRGLLLILLLAVIASITGCGKESVAVVNGKQISKDEYIDKLERLQTPQGGGIEAGNFVLQQLINEQLILDMAKDEGVYPTEAQVQEMYDEMAKAPGFSESIQKSGWSKEKMMQRLYLIEAEFNLRTKGVKVTDEEVRKYYDDNKDELFTTPESINISVIVTKDKATAESALNTLKKGVEFATVANQFSIDEMTKANGGQVPKTYYNVEGDETITPELRKLLFSTKLGELTKPLPGREGSYQIFKVTKKTDKEVHKFEEVSSRIRRMLMLKAGEKNNDSLQEKLDSFRNKSSVTVNIDRYKEQLEIKNTEK